MNNQYTSGSPRLTPLRDFAQTDEMRLNLSSIGAYGSSRPVPTISSQQQQPPTQMHTPIGNTSAGVYYSSGRNEQDNRSISSTPSKISKFTYSEYPQIRPTNPLYTSTATIKTGGASSVASRATTLNTVSRRQKYNPNTPRRIQDWRWASVLAALLFFPTGLIALGLAVKAQTKFDDGFIQESKKLNNRACALMILSFLCAFIWILAALFAIDQWPRTYG